MKARPVLKYPAGDPDRHTRRAIIQWIAACTAGELLGFGAAALWAWIAVLVFGAEPVSWMGRLGVLALMILAGVCEGTVLAALQWSALRHWFPGLQARPWISATAAVAAFGWFVGMLPSTLIGNSGTDPARLIDPPWWLVMAGAALFGALAGALFGCAQWLVLRRHAHGAGRWIMANAVGWALGLPWSYLAGSSTDVSQALLWAVVSAVLAGALMGLAVALATAHALLRLQPTPPTVHVEARQGLAGDR
jgi:hypothetical protein